MDFEERFKLYERLYFHESDRREKISARLSITFAALLATVGFLSFMLNSESRPTHCVTQVFFWLLFTTSAASLMAGAWMFRKAWYGTLDEHPPSAKSIEAYHSEMTKTYEGYEGGEAAAYAYFRRYLFNCYIDTSSVLTANNDARTSHINRSNFYLTIAVLLSFLAAIPFYLG